MAPTAQAQPLSALPTAIERRFYPRIVPLAPICISINDANQCLVINVSENGLLLSTRTGLPRNSVARIALPLDGLPKPVVVNIRVLWTSEIRRLAGIQILDVTDHDRQQIRKWGSYVSSTSLHREVQHDPQRKPDQHRIVEPFPKTNGKTKAESPSTPKLPLNNSAVAPSPSTLPSPSGIRGQSPSIMFLVALCVVGAFIFRSGAMEHSFARSVTTSRANAI
ncbi:MAG TPA: PilZ domain-containing protein, partial [Candidatus Acidoferrum sp.]|nr:PilZ domain-containing protein [Candidatus Acidoferrum sp.]